MTHEESIEAANRILAEAGWHAHPDWGGAYVNVNLVGGIQPDRQGCHFKDFTKIRPGHPLYSADTPDEPHEAAAWLVARFGAAPAETPATPDEPLTEFSHETSGESAEPHAEPDYAEAADFADEPDEPIDADFTELDVLEPEALTDDFAGALLEGADLGAEVLEENEPSGAFIFGDNLAHDRIVRIGQLAVRASVLIDVAKASYDEAEHNAVRSHVVTNMNEAGAYTGGDQARFNRFIALEAVVAQVRSIEQFRDAQQDYIRNAMHEAVAAFDPEAGWPA